MVVTGHWKSSACDPASCRSHQMLTLRAGMVVLFRFLTQNSSADAPLKGW